jgi:GNAT superfamily N-acetyltransferase
VIDYSLAVLDEEIERAFVRLFPDDAAEKSAARLRWRYHDGPHGPGRVAIARDMAKGGRIMGLIGLIALRLRTAGGPLHSFQAVDVVVDPDCRGHGVFAGLGKVAIEGAAELGKDVLWGFPNENAAPAWFGRFSWLRFGTVPFMVRPLRTGYFLGRLSSALGRFDVPMAVAKSKPDPDVREIREFGPEVERLWQRFAPPGPAVDRDARWLRWRLMDRPGADYRIAVLDQGDEATAMVASVVLNRHGGRILYVLEAMGSEPGQLARLLRHEVGLAAALGADAALCWCPARAPNRRAYRRAGFLHLPDRLRPVTMHFGARPLPANPPALLSDGAAWYLSYLDSDTI